MRDQDISALVVADGDGPVGMVTDLDITRKVTAEGLDPREIKISAIMRTPLITLEADLPMEEAILEMRKYDIRHIAATQGGRVAGMLSIKDFANLYHSSTIKDPVKEFWSYYECLLEDSAFNDAIDKLLRGMAAKLPANSSTRSAIEIRNSVQDISQVAQEEGLAVYSPKSRNNQSSKTAKPPSTPRGSPGGRGAGGGRSILQAEGPAGKSLPVTAYYLKQNPRCTRCHKNRPSFLLPG